MMRTNTDDWLISHGHRITRPQRRLAVSPRVAAKEFERPAISGRHVVAVVRALVNRTVCAMAGHVWVRSDPHVVSIWDLARGEYTTTRYLTRTCRRCERWRVSRARGGAR